MIRVKEDKLAVSFCKTKTLLIHKLGKGIIKNRKLQNNSYMNIKIKILIKILQIEFFSVLNVLKIHTHHIEVVFISGVWNCFSIRKSINHIST